MLSCSIDHQDDVFYRVPHILNLVLENNIGVVFENFQDYRGITLAFTL